MQEVHSPKALKAAQRKLRRANKAMARKERGSSNRAKAVRRVAAVHLKVANQRADFLHKLTTMLARTKRAIAVESLNVAGMVRNGRLARAVCDAGFAEFVRQLEYKTGWYGSKLWVADRWYASSKACSAWCHQRWPDPGAAAVGVPVRHCPRPGPQCRSEPPRGEDVGHLRVTYHHNFFDGSNQRHPRVRFGNPVHVFNNYYRNNGGYGVASTCNAGVYVERNYFENVGSTVVTQTGDSPQGNVKLLNNFLVNSGAPESRNPGSVAAIPYSYTVDANNSVKSIVMSGAGTGKI